MVETTRRSRIQQVEYNTTAPQGLNLVQLHSNGPPPSNIVSSATNKTSKSKQILGIQGLNAEQRQPSNKFGSLIQSQPNEKAD